ncbi:MAG: hypothetical protein ACLTDR_15005 [Adlercreutzia equolifaciens]
MEKERAEGLAAHAEEAVEGATARVAAEGGDGAAVVGEPEKCNTVTFVGADGMEQSFPLTFAGARRHRGQPRERRRTS